MQIHVSVKAGGVPKVLRGFIVAALGSLQSCSASHKRATDLAEIPSDVYKYGCLSAVACSSRIGGSVWVARFWIRRTEVTVREYDECVNEGSCADDVTDKGIVSEDEIARLTASSAAAYCAWSGGALPTEVEWQTAATGGDGRTYPWGDGFDEDLPGKCYFRSGGSESGYFCLPGQSPDGDSPFHIHDMSGTLPEFVISLSGRVELRGAPQAPPWDYSSRPHEFSISHATAAGPRDVGAARCVYRR